MSLDTLPELRKLAEAHRRILLENWDENVEPFVPYSICDCPKQKLLNNIRKNSIYMVQGFFSFVDVKLLFDPDTLLKYVHFRAYLEETDFRKRTATEQDMQQAKSLLESFIAYASKNLQNP
jgi:hypothetical protein